MVLRFGSYYVGFPHLQTQQSLYFVDTSYVFHGVIP